MTRKTCWFRHFVYKLIMAPSCRSDCNSISADDDVCPESEYEKQLYERLSHQTQLPALQLSSRWREPSLTVHEIEVSGPKSLHWLYRGLNKANVSLNRCNDYFWDSSIKNFNQDCSRSRHRQNCSVDVRIPGVVFQTFSFTKST
jgi:hypothetical protein